MSNYLNDLIDIIGDKDISINVISKSGTTTEPAIAFRVFREFLENKLLFHANLYESVLLPLCIA